MSSVDSGEFSYAYKSSLMGAPLEFQLAPDALEWRKGTMTGRTPYGRVRRIRLSFRPMTMQNYRFVTEVWPDSGPKLQIASTSWKSLVEHQRLDAEYRAFVSELSRRIGAAGGNTAFDTGSPAVPLLARRRHIHRRGAGACGARGARAAAAGVGRRGLRRGILRAVSLSGRQLLPAQPAGDIPSRCGAAAAAAESSRRACARPAPSTWRSAPCGRRSSRGSRSSSRGGASSSR